MSGAVTAVLLLATMSLPALAEDSANDAAQPFAGLGQRSHATVSD